MIRRRDLIMLVGGAAAAWPLAARAQQTATTVVGFLNGESAVSYAPMVAAFRRGLSTVGYVEGQNLAIEFRWSENQPDQLPTLAADLVEKRVAAIAATGGVRAVLAAKRATADIPIVFTSGSDPIRLGIINSFNRPGGNLTGVNMLITEIGAKRLGLLHELLPAAARIAVMVDPNNPDSDTELKDVHAAALCTPVLRKRLRPCSRRLSRPVRRPFRWRALRFSSHNASASRRLPRVITCRRFTKRKTTLKPAA